MLYSHVTLLMLRVVDVVVKTTVQQSARMLVADIPGDIQIGALFPMHRQIAGAEGCGAVWEQYGIQRAEIAMLTIQELNKHLPFRLGISIRDSCWTERIAMEQTIAFLREGVTQCSCCQTAGCQKKANPVVAIVGPAKSSTTIAVQNLLQVFRIPQIGYGATTTDLSDKEQFGYYLRVVPSDVWQARAINQLLRHFNWTYIAVVYSAGNYGEKGFEALERLTHSPGIDVCIAHAQKVKSLADEKEFEKVLVSMLQLRPRPQVVVCFCEGLSMKKMFIAQRNLRKKNPDMRTFQWIGSDGWADRLDVVEGVEEEAAGSFSIRIHSPKVESFEPYYFALNPINHTINPWFREFWQQKFKCQLTVPKDDTVTPVCTGKENLTLNYEQDPKLSHVINSVRVVGFALKAMYNDKCRHYNSQTYLENGYSPASARGKATSGAHHRPKGSSAAAAYEGINGDEGSLDNPVVESDELLMKNAGRSLLCPEMETINGTLLYKYMINVTFTDQFQQEISFDTNGDPPAWYDILNYVGAPEGFQLAGDFRQTRSGTHFLRMTNKPKLFFDKSSVLPESVCSKPCSIGQRQRQTTVCCWICENCAEKEIVNYTLNKCQNCPFGEWPLPNRTGCFILPHEYHQPTTASSLTALVFALMGILCTLIIIIFFINYSSTPVVKSTTRELSFIILSGVCACYVCTFVILSRPSFVTCFASRTLPPIAFSVVYSALLTKTNRIARILAGSKKRILTKKPRFLTTFSQVVITWILVGVQCVIVAVGVMEEMPQAGFEKEFLPKRMVLICTSSSWAFMAPFVWNFLLILFCTLYAFKTRNLPENFNEAKFIGFTMYCTLVVWAAFVVLYLNAVNKALTMSFTFSISASIALVLLFFPKIYIIVLHPEKNVRSSYTTTKLIRCHFGNSQGTGDSKHLSSRTRTSLQSSTSMSYPTRTASLHVANNNPSTDRDSPSAVTMAAGGGGAFDPSTNYGGASPIDTMPSGFQRTASSHRQHSQHSHHSQYSLAGALGGGVGVGRVGSVRYHPHGRREVGIQTSPVAEPTILGQGSPPTPAASVTSGGGSGGGPTSAASRFIRTFSVIGGAGHSHHRKHDSMAASGVGDSSATNKGATLDDSLGTPSRRKTLDDDVLQLIDSCRRYQDERINSASTQMQNYLLEEEICEEDEGQGGGQVSQMLAGSIERGMRTVFSTVSRTAAVGAPKLSTAGVGAEPPLPMYVPSLVVKTSHPPSIVGPPTRARAVTVFPRKKSSSVSTKSVRGNSVDLPTTPAVIGYESVRHGQDLRGAPVDSSVGHLPPPPPPPLAQHGRRISAVLGIVHNNRHDSAELKPPPAQDDIVGEDNAAEIIDEVVLDEDSEKAREFRQQQHSIEEQQQQYADDIFEMLFRSRGADSVHLSNATQL